MNWITLRDYSKIAYDFQKENYNIVLVNNKDNLLGKNIKVKIKNIGVHHMIGEIKN